MNYHFISRDHHGFKITNRTMEIDINLQGEITRFDIPNIHKLVRRGHTMFSDENKTQCYFSCRTSSVMFTYQLNSLGVIMVYSVNEEALHTDIYLHSKSTVSIKYKLYSHITLPDVQAGGFTAVGKKILNPLVEFTTEGNTLSLCKEQLKKCIVLSFTPCLLRATPIKDGDNYIYTRVTMEWHITVPGRGTRWITLKTFVA